MKTLTHINGAPVIDNANVQTAGPRGPALIQDVWFQEKLAHFTREIIPERRMHAKGSGAYGTFTVTHDITKYTNAKLFSELGKETEVFVRFSTVVGERGAADAERDVRGYAARFYTEEGNWDFVGLNTPVFFLRDPIKFPDLGHSQKRDPRTGLRCLNSTWDFWTQSPEALHQITILMSDRGIPRTYRHMHGFANHAFSFINADNERVWVKIVLKTNQGIENLTDEEAGELIGRDRESHGRDLFDAIETGDFPSWTMYIQVMTEEQAAASKQNPFDATKVWSQKTYPLIEVGQLVLNRNPENYFSEVEQAGFTPANIVPGIGYSPDKLLQGRLFVYGDALRYRIGTNLHQIPVNRPRCPFASFHRDGAMRVDDNFGGEVGYAPNSDGVWGDHRDRMPPPMSVGAEATHWAFAEDDSDYYSQPRALFNLMTAEQRAELFSNTARSLSGASRDIQKRHIENCAKASPDYAKGVEEALNAM
ncbi:catalase [Stappia taiwanensis]|uniref:catalase n=1 Tax=Stappia taiwanensis TaxID=992267 RepID=A0A838XPQ5_9HYPH|nr:catalase [Stappia taiwanensis]MBA4611777.1 catalase [Stappia taiwanensis]GGE96862.1 catalase [Stappia taiwanensis]